MNLYHDAFQRILSRLESTARDLHEGFPHYADPETGAWTASENGDWTGGFWVGMLWIAYRATKEECFHTWAHRWMERLWPRASSETVFRGFLFYYGAALGDILTNDKRGRQAGGEGALGLASLFNPAAKIIPLGSAAEEATSVGRTEANVDGLQASALLAWAADRFARPDLRDIAVQHARRSLELFVRADHSVCQSASFDVRTGEAIRRYTHKGIRDDSTWTRAQAWALLGATVDAIWLGEMRAELLSSAVPIADWWLRHVPADLVSYWDFDAPQHPPTPRDTSGTAIAAAALLKLSALCERDEDRSRFRSAAESTVAALVKNYLAPTCDGDTRIAGMLAEGCYNYRIGLATRHELVWGTYYLFEALSVLTGALQPAEI